MKRYKSVLEMVWSKGSSLKFKIDFTCMMILKWLRREFSEK